MRKNVFLACISRLFRVIWLSFRIKYAYASRVFFRTFANRAGVFRVLPSRALLLSLRRALVTTLPQTQIEQRKSYFSTGVVLVYKLCYYAICKNLRRGQVAFFSQCRRRVQALSRFVCRRGGLGIKAGADRECRRCLWKGLPDRTYRCWIARSI